MFIRRFSDHGSKALEQQPENGVVLAFGPALVPFPAPVGSPPAGLLHPLPRRLAQAVP
jgi:hypothetical protein